MQLSSLLNGQSQLQDRAVSGALPECMPLTSSKFMTGKRKKTQPNIALPSALFFSF